MVVAPVYRDVQMRIPVAHMPIRGDSFRHFPEFFAAHLKICLLKFLAFHT